MNLKGFLKECHDKEVFKMLSIYVVSSWVILQVLALIAEPLNFPEKSVTFMILVLIIGFPIYIYYIWKFRLKKLELKQTGDDAVKFYKSPFHRMYFSALLAISVLASFSAVVIINTNLINDFKLQEVEGNDKIAVLVFENFTGDEKLNIVGEMAANWIIHGITENEVAQVISPKVVSDYTSIIKSQAQTVDIKNLLKTYFKPGRVITGGFYKENDKLLLQASVMDGQIDKTLISFETIECNLDTPLNCIEELKQKVLGYLIIQGKIHNFEETPPNFEAFEYNLSALKNFGNDSLHLDYINKAIKADPKYFEPKIHKISYYYNLDEFRIADSLRKSIGINSKLSLRQQSYLSFYESVLKGKYDKAYNAIKKEYEIAYLDIPTNMSTMTIALQFVNRPGDIDEIFQKEIPMENIMLDKCLQCGFRYYLKGLADVQLQKYELVIDELLPLTKIIDDVYLKKPLVMAYVRSGNTKALNEQLTLWELSMDKSDLFSLEMFVGNEYLLVNNLEQSKIHFMNLISNANQINDPTMVAYSFYFSQNYNTAQSLLESIHGKDPNNSDVIVKLAISNYKNGNKTESEQLINGLNELRSEYQFGVIDYGFAQYFAMRDDKVNTFNHLLKAVASGMRFTPTTFQNDPHFLAYRDTQAFKDILNYWNQFL